MTSLATLRRKLEQVIENAGLDDRQYLQKKQKQRQDFIDAAFLSGGQGFLERVQRFGTTEKGEELQFNPWFRDLLLIIGDLRLQHVLTTGCAQLGKTTSHNLFISDCLTSGKLNTAWFYDSRTNLDANVPMQFKPIVESWVARMHEEGISISRSGDRTTNTRYQVDQTTAIFSYVSTSRTGAKADGGRAIAGGAVVSFQADLAVLEERSQYPPGAADPIPRRLDASMIPTRPVRELGTPGGGQGIEASMKDVDHYFYPHFQCDRCQQVHPLDPKGCLLRSAVRPDPIGQPRTVYLSEAGRPQQWWHSDPSDPLKTAYFACPGCGHLISDEKRMSARMCCRYTGVWAEDFLKNLSATIPERPWKIGVHISPLSRDEAATALASQIIKSGFDAINPDDWQQQRLGHPSEHEVSTITIEMLRRAILAPRPQGKPDYVLAGIDMGRSEDWLTIGAFYLPKNYRWMSQTEINENTIRVTQWAGAVVRDQIPALLQEYGVSYGLVDNEPSRESSMRLCKDTVLEMADQRSIQQPVSETIVEDGGIPFKCWIIRNVKFMNSVLEGFLMKAADGHSLYRLPSEWERWVGNPSDRSPLVHMSGPWRDTDGHWNRPGNKVDDLFFAHLFMEAAFYIKLQTPEPDYTIASAGERPIHNILRDL